MAGLIASVLSCCSLFTKLCSGLKMGDTMIKEFPLIGHELRQSNRMINYCNFWSVFGSSIH